MSKITIDVLTGLAWDAL